MGGEEGPAEVWVGPRRSVGGTPPKPERLGPEGRGNEVFWIQVVLMNVVLMNLYFAVCNTTRARASQAQLNTTLCSEIGMEGTDRLCGLSDRPEVALTPAAPNPPGLHTTAPEIHTCTFQGPGASKTPPKFHKKTPRETKKRAKMVAGEGKIAKFWAVRRRGGPAEGWSGGGSGGGGFG